MNTQTTQNTANYTKLLQSTKEAPQSTQTTYIYRERYVLSQITETKHRSQENKKHSKTQKTKQTNDTNTMTTKTINKQAERLKNNKQTQITQKQQHTTTKNMKDT